MISFRDCSGREVNMSTPISEPLQQWLTNTLGPYQCTETIQDKDRSTVWRITARDTKLIVKLIKTQDRWEREVHAYRAWSEPLKPYVPELIAASAEQKCLVLTSLRGWPMKDIRLSESLALQAYDAAGKLARRFRDAAVGEFFGDPDSAGRPMGETWRDPVAFMAGMFMPAFERVMSDGGLDDCARAVALWGRDNLDAFARQPCIPVNPDFDTGNWLVDEHDGFIGIIDFEYARWGVEYETFMPIWTRDYARLCDGAEEAFLAAYGYVADANAARRKRVGFINSALHGVIYSLDQNLISLEYHRKMLRQLEQQP
jgi:hypothetical protein